jgi:hypothetical protein
VIRARLALVLAAVAACASNVNDPPPQCADAGTFSTGFACAEWCIVPEGYNFGTCDHAVAWRQCVLLERGDFMRLTKVEGTRDLANEDFKIRRVCP